MYIAKIIISIQFQLLQKSKINRFTLLAYFYFANSSIITIEHHVCYFVFSLHGNNLFFRIKKKMIIYFYTYNKRSRPNFSRSWCRRGTYCPPPGTARCFHDANERTVSVKNAVENLEINWTLPRAFEWLQDTGYP